MKPKPSKLRKALASLQQIKKDDEKSTYQLRDPFIIETTRTTETIAIQLGPKTVIFLDDFHEFERNHLTKHGIDTAAVSIAEEHLQAAYTGNYALALLWILTASNSNSNSNPDNRLTAIQLILNNLDRALIPPQLEALLLARLTIEEANTHWQLTKLRVHPQLTTPEEQTTLEQKLHKLCELSSMLNGKFSPLPETIARVL